MVRPSKPLLKQLEVLWHCVDELQAGGGGGGGPHTHTIANVTGLQSELDGKHPVGNYALTAHNHDGDYQPLGDYAASGHGHVIADVSGLQAALDGKQASGSYQPVGSYAAEVHGHAIGDVTGLQMALDGKQASGSYAAAAHSHVISDVTGLQAALDGKQASGSYALTSHNHLGVYEPVISAGTAAQYWRGDKTWQPLPGGADPWTYVKLANDFTTSSATAVDVTGMSFTPSGSTSYEFEAHLMCRTSTATVGPRPGVAWATGGTDGAASIYTPSSASAEVMAHGNINAAVLGPVGGLPNTTQSYGAKIVGMFVAGASPSGAVKLQLASETAGTNVTIKAGSFLKYRTI